MNIYPFGSSSGNMEPHRSGEKREKNKDHKRNVTTKTHLINAFSVPCYKYEQGQKNVLKRKQQYKIELFCISSSIQLKSVPSFMVLSQSFENSTFLDIKL